MIFFRAAREDAQRRPVSRHVDHNRFNHDEAAPALRPIGRDFKLTPVTMIATFVVITALTACATRPVDKPRTGTGQENIRTFPQTVDKEVDILFLIDDSTSMKGEQENLNANFDKLIEALRSTELGPDGSGRPCTTSDTSGCRIPDVRIGVISPNLGVGNALGYQLSNSCKVGSGTGLDGILQNTPRRGPDDDPGGPPPSCTTPQDPWISYTDGKSNVRESGDQIEAVKEAFKCIARLGGDGCGFEQQLEAARRALDPALNKNPGFIRPNALLAVVWITDEDDCSVPDSNSGLFSLNQESNRRFGPTRFRCFEFSTTCDGRPPSAEREPGERQTCELTKDIVFSVTGRLSLLGRESYETFFKGLKPFPGRVILSALAGPATLPVTVVLEDQIDGDLVNPQIPFVKPSCLLDPTQASKPVQFQDSGALPAFRISALINSFSGRDGHVPGQFTSICTDNFGPALATLGENILGALGRQCVNAPLLDESGALVCHGGESLGGGIACPTNGCLERAECNVEEISNPGGATQTKTKIEACSADLFKDPSDNSCGSACPCWRIVPNAECDAAEDGTPYAFEILRAPGVEPSPGTFVVSRCNATTEKWGSADLFKFLDSDDDGSADRICP